MNVTLPAVPEDGEQHALTVVFDGDSRRTYIDGKLTESLQEASPVDEPCQDASPYDPEYLKQRWGNNKKHRGIAKRAAERKQRKASRKRNR